MTIKLLDDGTSYTKAHAHDWEDPNCQLKGRCEIYIKIDGIRAIRNRDGRVWSRNSKPLPHLDHLSFKDAEIFRDSWNTTSSILGSDAPPASPLTQENVYELSDGNIDKRLYLGWAQDPSNEKLHELMLKMLKLGHEGLIVRCKDKKGKTLWWKIVPYKYADVKITGFKEGTNKNKGVCGSIATNYGSAGSMVFDCLQDHNIVGDYNIRKWLWEHRHELIGKIIQVRYREVTEAGKFRFPSLVRLRTDKSEESLD
ncbi:putative DNA ligase [Erwinia phage Fifi44]|uniref:DNA ligase n=1 Tax=Erwinia phage Fifi44 TaxID=2876597 RepID=A0AAE8Y1A7_9CAUD|nr:putative DNA ligase [Erwinia phage Fifi44]UCR74914.1 putative DNA ligase [Erwinia phage Fifi44]UCR80853.1 putative DNA ligase [Erwinia phage Fifi451]